MKTLVIAIRISLVTLLLTGVVYPLVTTGLAKVLFNRRADGSMQEDDKGKVVGSSLIGQPFSNPAYLQPRPSAAGSGYDGASSSGSNHGPRSVKLRNRVALDVERLTRENPEAQGKIPAELVTASGSGLDPHISPAAARWQVPRIARARGLAPERVAAVVAEHVEGRDLGFLGEPRVNVLLTNLALDRQFGKPENTAGNGTATTTP